jgi:hypothetical protein
MATFYELPLANDFPYFVVNSSGASVPASGYKLFLYSTGTTTKITTYTDSTGGTPNANPVLLGSTGLPQSGANVVGIWVAQGQTVKAVFAPSTDTDPPGSPIWTRDFGANPPGINDPTANLVANSEWIASGLAPTFISATSFSVTGDQTSILQADRRIKTTNSGGTIYSTIKTSSFGAGITTLVVVNDSGVIDSGLSTLSYALLSATNRSIPPINTLVDGTDPSKKLTFTISGLPTATTKTVSAVLPETFCDGRLTLTSGTAITTSDVTAATTVYFTPFRGNRISTYNGNFWNSSTFTEKSIAVPGSTSSMYDLFIVDSSLALEAVAWTNDTTRATALTTQDGIYVKTGDATRRYLGSFRTTTVSGKTEDSFAKRYLWNYYNRVRRPMLVAESTVSWNYTTAAWRQANNSASNQLDFIIGVVEEQIEAEVHVCVANTTGNGGLYVGIALDATNTNNATVDPEVLSNVITKTSSAYYRSFVTAGRHFLAWVEYSAVVVGTTTWTSADGVAGIIAGIMGKVSG